MAPATWNGFTRLTGLTVSASLRANSAPPQDSLQWSDAGDKAERSLAERKLERPFHFIIVLWGRHYTNYFLEYCVPSLLAPGNLPALNTVPRSKIVIATRPEDWAEIQSSNIFRSLERYVDPVYIEIPPCPKDKSGCEHMGVGHKAACKIAHDEKAYAAILTPDCMLSDGIIRNLQKHAQNGVQLVWVAALRFGEEPFLGHLKGMGLIPDGSRRDSGAPLVISGRDMVFAGVNGMHSETLSYEWEASYFASIPSAVWWRVPGENGIVVHSLSWAPMLLDFAAVRTHDTSALENWTIDGDYAFKNLGPAPKVHVVQDSDEMFLCSWGPLADRAFDLKPRFNYRFNLVNNLLKGHGLRSAFYGPFFDPLKRQFFFLPVYWHVDPLNKRWHRVERKAQKVLYIHIGKSSVLNARILDRGAAIVFGLWVKVLRSLSPLSRVVHILRTCWQHREIVATRAAETLSGDKRAWTRVIWRARQAGIYITTGQFIDEKVVTKKAVKD